jgi:hypothetical protein
MPVEAKDKDVRLMTLAEIEAELARLDERRRLLMRVRRLIVELNGDGGRNEGRRPSDE